MTSTNLKDTQKVNEPVETRIEIEPIPFDGLLKSKITSTVELSKVVNSVFANALADYEGCIILPTQSGSFECSLYFKDKPVTDPNQIKSVQPVTAARPDSGLKEKIERINSLSANKIYTLTEETKQILSHFISVRGNQKINRNNHVFEQGDQTFAGNIIYVKVTGIDLYKILKAVYGGKVDGDRCEYNVSMIRASGPNNFLISVQQLDTKAVEKLAQSIGMIPNPGSIMMVRG